MRPSAMPDLALAQAPGRSAKWPLTMRSSSLVVESL